jgi:Type IV secretion system pilin
MKKIIIATLSGLAMIGVAYAQDLIHCPDGTMADPSIGCVKTPASVMNPATGIPESLLKIASLSLTVAIVVTTALLIYGGIRYATALGDEDKLQKSKRLFFWSVVGLVVSLTARLLIGGVAGLIA